MKKRPLILSATWLVTTAGAVGLGWTLKSMQSSDAEAITQTTGTSLVPTERLAGKPAMRKLRADEAFLANYLKGGKISPADMKLAMDKLMKENDPLRRAALFAALLDQLLPENAKDAFTALKESMGGRRGGRGGGRGGDDGGDEMEMLLNAWGRVDGEGAIAELTALREARNADGEGERNERGGRGGGGQGGRGGGGTSGDGGGGDFMMPSQAGPPPIQMRRLPMSTAWRTTGAVRCTPPDSLRV